MPSTATQDLRDHLESMFQFENGDLDFGIYKVLRLKRNEVSAFLDTELGEIVTTELSKAMQGAADAQFERLASYVREEKGQRYQVFVFSPQTVAENREELRKAVLGADDEAELLAAINESGSVDPEIENRVYNHLLAFFGRYYKNGDFGYNDRSLATYKVDYPPAEADYDGSDVLLHWKHKDSYYIKTANGFPTVRFEIDGKIIEYRLETGGEDEQARTRNNNKDDGRKHYALDRTETMDDGVVQVVFRLAERSTSKADVFARVMDVAFGVSDGLDDYLYRPAVKGEERGKPAFNDLEGDYDKVDNGGLKGQGQLRLGLDSYLGAIIGHDAFKALGSNTEKRKAALVNDETVNRLHTLDQRLNRFYVGVDADYFVHKDLGGFLRREAGRYVKDVVLSGVEGLLAEERDETAFLVARAFYRVADRIIGFLAATEEFQKNLFLLKKKVVQTDWLVSVGKLGEWIADNEARSAILTEVASNEAQKAEWQATFGVEVVDPNQLLLTHPTLPIDTRHFDEAFTLRIIALCPDIETQTTGLLLNSENLQALRLLSESYRGKVKCVYIDPPYNTGSDGFLYKDAFRHSSWLSMMDDRLREGRLLMSRDGFLAMSIDDNEAVRAKALLDMVFGSSNFIANIVWQKRYVSNSTAKHLSDMHDHVFMYASDEASLSVEKWERTEEQLEAFKNPDDDSRGPWRAQDLSAGKPYSAGLYTIVTPTGLEADPPPGRYWRCSRKQYDAWLSEGRITFGLTGEGRPMLKNYLKEGQQGVTPHTWWSHKFAGHNKEAKLEVKSIFGDAVPFSTPKPVKLIERIATSVQTQRETVLDYSKGRSA